MDDKAGPKKTVKKGNLAILDIKRPYEIPFYLFSNLKWNLHFHHTFFWNLLYGLIPSKRFCNITERFGHRHIAKYCEIKVIFSNIVKQASLVLGQVHWLFTVPAYSVWFGDLIQPFHWQEEVKFTGFLWLKKFQDFDESLIKKCQPFKDFTVVNLNKFISMQTQHLNLISVLYCQICILATQIAMHNLFLVTYLFFFYDDFYFFGNRFQDNAWSDPNDCSRTRQPFVLSNPYNFSLDIRIPGVIPTEVRVLCLFCDLYVSSHFPPASSPVSFHHSFEKCYKSEHVRSWRGGEERRPAAQCVLFYFTFIELKASKVP